MTITIPKRRLAAAFRETKPRLTRRKFRNAAGQLVESPVFYGEFMDEYGKRARVSLDTGDPVAAAAKLQSLADHAKLVRGGLITRRMTSVARAATKSVPDHAVDYLEANREQWRPGHYEGVKSVLNRLIALAGWRRLDDLTAETLTAALDRLRADGKTIAYRNGFVKRAKAFNTWLVAQGRIDGPRFAGVKRAKFERGGRMAKSRRDRRALTGDELIALLTAAPTSTAMRGNRRLKYALCALAGLRRSELADLRWGDLRLKTPIPFIQLRPEQTKNGKADALPLHPYLVNLLADVPEGEEDDRVVDSVPDLKSLKKDLAAAGIPFTKPSKDGNRQRRADVHSLRHTLASLLGSTGASDTVKKAIMRHADESVTDGYSHAHLSELATALARVPSPAIADGCTVPELCQNNGLTRRDKPDITRTSETGAVVFDPGNGGGYTVRPRPDARVD